MKTKNINIDYRLLSIVLLLFLSHNAISQYDSVYRFNKSFDGLNDTSSINLTESTYNLNFETIMWGDENAGITPADVLFIGAPFNKIYMWG